MPLSVYLLAVAVFAMGTSEFMLAGLVPDIASDFAVPVGTAGLLTSAFAVGMMIGAPLMAALARRWSPRISLLGFLLVFAASHVVSAATGSFAILFATRIVAALANAGFLAVALTAAAALVSSDRKGRALSVLLAGTTVAVIAGVPGGSVLGTVLGWRATFWAVAALCVPAALGILGVVPVRGAEDEKAGPALRLELAQLRSGRLLLVMVLGALVNAATFGSFTFLAPVVTGTAGLGELWISVALVLFGVGSFVGVTVAGRLSDRRPGLVVAVGGPVLLAGWSALALLAAEPIALFVLVFVQGVASFAVGSTLITRILYESTRAPTMAGSYATATLNVGAAVGPLVAATTLGTSDWLWWAAGNLGPIWVSGFLVLVALVVALPFRRVLTASGDGAVSRR